MENILVKEGWVVRRLKEDRRRVVRAVELGLGF
jgi:hypothetical protein